MKIACLLMALTAIVLYGCEQKSDVEMSETDVGFDEDLETFVNRVLEGGYNMGGAGRDGMKTIAEVTNIKLLYANYKSSQKLQKAIEEFNISSTALANKMLWLTIVIAILTLVMAYLTIIQVASPNWRCVQRLRELVKSMAKSYIRRFPKTESSTSPQVKQYQVNNESKDSSRKTPI